MNKNNNLKDPLPTPIAQKRATHFKQLVWGCIPSLIAQKRIPINKQLTQGFTPSPIAKKRVTHSKQLVRGFTIIEVLIVSGIIALISFTIYSSFNKGLQVWSKVSSPLASEDILIVFQRLDTDLRNSFSFSKVNFSGAVEELGFPAIINSARMHSATVGKVKYSYDPARHALYRSQIDYPDMIVGKDDEEYSKKKVLDNVVAANFQYNSFDTQLNEYAWSNSWAKKDLPQAVRLTIEVSDGQQTVNYTKSVSIPVAN